MRDTIRQAITLLAGLAIGALAAHVIGRLHEPHTSPETVVIERVDTLVLRDTITAYKPVPFNVYVVDTLYVPVEVPGQHDTVWAALPWEEKEYRDSTYRAVVSGFRPSLDTIDVYRRTEIIEKERTVYVQPSRWSIGVQAGATLTDAGVKPGIGIGIQYTLWPLGRSR